VLRIHIQASPSHPAGPGLVDGAPHPGDRGTGDRAAGPGWDARADELRAAAGESDGGIFSGTARPP
jgi:hypothetical protein